MTNWKISINFAAILGVVLVIWCCVHSDPVMRYIGVAGAIYLCGGRD